MGKGVKSLGMKTESDWEAEDAMRTLMRADEIRKDKKLMNRVSAMAKARLMQMAEIAGESGEADD
jgi:hypothetical protein